jgi:ubiquitin C-terminal hydrolase
MLGICKYNNINNVTCYMNSILTILQQTPIFSDFILSKELQTILKNKYSDEEQKDLIIFQLYRLFKVSLSHNNANITPTTFRQVLSNKCDIWGENQHQDSQEFLNFIITNMEEEITQKVIFIPKNTYCDLNDNLNIIDCLENISASLSWKKFIEKEYSPIKSLFTGLQKTILTCSFCNNISNNFEPFQLLSLSIPIKNKDIDIYKNYDLTELIDNYTNEEILDNENMIKCDFCYVKNKQKKKYIFWKTPKILIIQIKRFLMNDYGIINKKLNNMINYPLVNLDLNKYIDTKSPDKYNYNLFGVNIHHKLGNINSINFGHYTSYIKSRLDDKWYHFDDNQPIELINDSNVITEKAYLLFYYRNN